MVPASPMDWLRVRRALALSFAAVNLVLFGFWWWARAPVPGSGERVVDSPRRVPLLELSTRPLAPEEVRRGFPEEEPFTVATRTGLEEGWTARGKKGDFSYLGGVLLYRRTAAEERFLLPSEEEGWRKARGFLSRLPSGECSYEEERSLPVSGAAPAYTFRFLARCRGVLVFPPLAAVTVDASGVREARVSLVQVTGERGWEKGGTPRPLLQRWPQAREVRLGLLWQDRESLPRPVWRVAIPEGIVYYVEARGGGVVAEER